MLILNDEDVQKLLKVEKEFITNDPLLVGERKFERKLKSISGDEFTLNYKKASIEGKFTFNKRRRTSIVLFRYDKGKPHTNPDGEYLTMLHIHIYREGYGDRRAYPATEIGILETDDNGIVAKKLLKYRNVKNPPQIKSSLF